MDDDIRVHAKLIIVRAWEAFRRKRDEALESAFSEWRRMKDAEHDDDDDDDIVGSGTSDQRMSDRAGVSSSRLPVFLSDDGASSFTVREELLVKEAIVRLYLRDRRETHNLFTQYATAAKATDANSKPSFPPISLRRSYDVAEVEEVLSLVRLQEATAFAAMGSASPDASKCGDLESIMDRTGASICRSSIASAPSPNLYVDFAAISDHSVAAGSTLGNLGFHPDGGVRRSSGLEISHSFFLALNTSGTEPPQTLEQITAQNKAVTISDETTSGVSSQELATMKSKQMDHVRKGGWTTMVSVYSALRGRQHGIVSVRKVGNSQTGRLQGSGFNLAAHGSGAAGSGGTGVITTSMEVSSAAIVHFPVPVERSPTRPASAAGDAITADILRDSDAPFPRTMTLVSFEAPVAAVEKPRPSPHVTSGSGTPPLHSIQLTSQPCASPQDHAALSHTMPTVDVCPPLAPCTSSELTPTPSYPTEVMRGNVITPVDLGAAPEVEVRPGVEESQTNSASAPQAKKKLRVTSSTHMEAFAKRHAKIKPFSPAAALAEAMPKRGLGSPHASPSRSPSPEAKEGGEQRPQSSASTRPSTPSAVVALRQRIMQQRQALGMDPSLSELVDQLASLRAASRMKIDKMRRLRTSQQSESRPGSAAANSDIIENPTSQPMIVVTRSLTPTIAQASSCLVPPLLRSRRHLAPLLTTPPMLSDTLGSSTTLSDQAEQGSEEVVVEGDENPVVHMRRLRVHQPTPAEMNKVRTNRSTAKERSAIEPTFSVARRIEASREPLAQVPPSRNVRGHPPLRSAVTAAQAVDIMRIPTISAVKIATHDDLAYLKQLHAKLF